MFRNVEKEMEIELKLLMRDGHFDRAKALGRHLENLRKEFGDLQLNDELRMQSKQKKLFDKATRIHKKQMSGRHNEWSEEVETQCAEFSKENEKFFEIQRENLALEMSRIEKPRMKYSKTRMEYKNAEIRLCALKQYDDAKNVRRMLKSIDAREEKKFDEDFKRKMQAKIDKLEKFQKETRARQEEKVSHVRWRELRKREKEAHIAKTNIGNKTRDMHHFMALDAKMKPELMVKPSALLQKRANYKNTASKLRGEQFLDKVKGKSEGDAVFIESLCTIHDFSDKGLLNTTTFGDKIQWKPYDTVGLKHFGE